MTVFLHVINAAPKRIEWDCPFIPREGEYLFTESFLMDLGIEIDAHALIVQNVYWHKLGDNICVSLFLTYDDDDKSEVDFSVFNSN